MSSVELKRAKERAAEAKAVMDALAQQRRYWLNPQYGEAVREWRRRLAEAERG
jgi:hypothetical protein